MSKATGLIAAVMAALQISCNCAHEDNTGPAHLGKTDIILHSMECDTLYINAEGISYTGFCMMHGDTILVSDKFIPGIRQYATDGQYLGTVMQNEPVAWIAAIDHEEGHLITLDGMSRVSTYDSMYMKMEGSGTCIIETDMTETMKELYDNPDPERYEMYEYNPSSQRMLAKDGRVYLPVITEHWKYNGYYGFSRKDYWRKSYIIEAFDAACPEKRQLFGHYPEVYRQSNIPVFANYDLQFYNEAIIVSFAAEHRLYAYDCKSGELLYTFGQKDKDIEGKYPQTHSLEGYDEVEAERYSYGQYCRIYSDGDFLVRTLVTDHEEWKLQVYRGTDLIGDIPCGGKVDVIGKSGDTYYAYMNTDYTTETILIIRFRLR